MMLIGGIVLADEPNQSQSQSMMCDEGKSPGQPTQLQVGTVTPPHPNSLDQGRVSQIVIVGLGLVLTLGSYLLDRKSSR